MKDGLNLLPSSSGGIINRYLNSNVSLTCPGQGISSSRSKTSRADIDTSTPFLGHARRATPSKTAQVPAPPERLAPLGHAFTVLNTLLDELVLAVAVVGSLLGVVRETEDSGTSQCSPPARSGCWSCSDSAAPWLRPITRPGHCCRPGCCWPFRPPTSCNARHRCLATLAVDCGCRRFGCGAGRSDAVHVRVWQRHAAADHGRQQAPEPEPGRGPTSRPSISTRVRSTAATWVSAESRGKLIYADRYGQLRLSATSGVAALQQLTPRTLDAHAWVYGTRTNVVLGRAHGVVRITPRHTGGRPRSSTTISTRSSTTA